MKKLLAISLLLGFIFSCQKKDLDDCVDTSLIKDDAFCTMDYNPVCGCDGETYANACIAKYHHGVTRYSNGPCNPDNTCEALEAPDLFMTGFEDPVWIIQSEIEEDCLHIQYRYAGGCENHDFKLRIMPIFCGTPPLPPTMLQFVHDANGDACEAALTGYAAYDLRSIRDSSANQVEFYLVEMHNGYSKKFIYQY